MIKRPSIFSLVCFLALLGIYARGSLAAQVSSQSPTASFRAEVADADHRRISGVAVLIENKDRTWYVRSDERGEFSIELPVGAYRVTFDKDGFKKLVVTDLIIKPGTTISHGFSMEPGWPIVEPDLKPELIRTEISLPNDLELTAHAAPFPQSAPNIGVNGYSSTDKVQRGHIVQIAVVMDIPQGYHVNSNRPLESFLKATQLKVDAPSGVRVGPVAYPRASLRKFSFSNDKLSVYEGRVVLRVSVTVPANFGGGSLELKGRLNYQSCNDAVCFPPQSREVKVEIPVVGANEAVKRINSGYFGRAR